MISTVQSFVNLNILSKICLKYFKKDQLINNKFWKYLHCQLRKRKRKEFSKFMKTKIYNVLQYLLQEITYEVNKAHVGI